MGKLSLTFLCLVTSLLGVAAYAENCPDPNTTSLQWGVPPEPWEVSPFSQSPQGEENTQFIRANILVAGYGQGVACSYRNSLGNYTIWWKVPTKIPARVDYNWIEIMGGYVCTVGLIPCQFYVANTRQRFTDSVL